MRRGSGPDHLAHSFTDLMTSLMVIFILLLLVFMNNQASVNSVTAQTLAADLRLKLVPAGFKPEDIRIDPKDPSTILLTMLEAQLTFEPNSSQLQPAGERFLLTRMPALTETICADKYRSSIEAVLVEGHSDSTPWRGMTPEESQGRNLKLSQERSMEVVEKTLASLSNRPGLRSCLLGKISAGGRGEQDLAASAGESRRAVIKVRVNATHAVDLANAIHAEKLPAPRVPPVPTAESAKVAETFARLQAAPRKAVNARLSDNEVNRYLVFALLSSPRPGIESMVVRFYPHDYVSTLTVIDFDEIDRWSPGLIPGFLELTGKKQVWIDFRFAIEGDIVSYTIGKAFYQNKSIPEFLAEKIVQTILARQPEGMGGQEIKMPLGLKQIETGEHYIAFNN